MDQIFNELSVSECYENKYAANAGIERMMMLISALSHCGFNLVLRVVQSFSNLFISPDYTMSEWARDRTVNANRDLQRLFLTATTKSPYIEELIADTEDNCLIEFKYEDQPALGLGLAYLWKTAVVSMDCDIRFTQPTVVVELYKICNSASYSQSISVESIYSFDQLQAACSASHEKQIASVDNGKALVKLLPTIFAHISCADDAISQLSNLTGSEQFFREIIRHFSILNHTMSQWDGGLFDPKGLTWSSESESTLNQFGKYRQFVCTDGNLRQFSLHTKIIASNQRIYYYPDFVKKVIHVGYVGSHLPTTRFKT